jgi:hypothetical protein
VSIEERVRNALVDLDCALRSGEDWQAVIGEIATVNGLKKEVLQARAERKSALGNLDEFQTWCRSKLAQNASEQAEIDVVLAFVDKLLDRDPQHSLPFIPIGNFIRTRFPEESPLRDRAFAASRSRQISIRQSEK